MPQNKHKKNSVKRSICPIACTLDILGDKWTPLVIRDLFAGKKTYGELQSSPENIPTNILAERLKRLIDKGIITKTPYQQRPVRYEYLLSPKGRALDETLQALMKWGVEYILGTKALIKPLKK